MIIKQLKDRRQEQIPEHWKERFYVKVGESFLRQKPEGERVPRFYLPVYRKYDENVVVCWIFLLAPIVLLVLIVRDMARSLWNDLITFRELLQCKNRPCPNCGRKKPLLVHTTLVHGGICCTKCYPG